MNEVQKQPDHIPADDQRVPGKDIYGNPLSDKQKEILKENKELDEKTHELNEKDSESQADKK